MKHIKTFFKALLGVIFLTVMYCVFIADRFLLAPFPRSLMRFQAWSQLSYKEEIRTYTDVYNSLARVFVVSVIIMLIWLFI